MLHSWNHRVYYFGGLFFLFFVYCFSAQHDSLEVHVYCVCQVMPFDCWVVFHSKDVSQFIYLLKHFQAGSSLWFLVLFLYKVLLAHNHVHLFTFCRSYFAELNNCTTDHIAHSLKYFLKYIGPFIEVWQPVFWACVQACSNLLNC